ncbi:hypothetical protein [uncultured Gilvimarinus sp.]|uniref:hypothetical protein n=1 Tax=uncultured Gilvimarinus sp. TaxID=1689143 RepID=UPI0030EF122F
MSNRLKDFIKVSYLWSGILFVSSVFGLIGNSSGAAAAVYLAELVLSIGMWRATVGIRHSAVEKIRLYKNLCGMGAAWGGWFIVWFYVEHTLKNNPGLGSTIFHFSFILVVSGPFVVLYRSASRLLENQD